MKFPKYYLSEDFFIKLIEFPALYNIKTDELYCIEQKALKLLVNIALQVNKVKAMNPIDEDYAKNNSINSNELSELIDLCLKEGILTKKPVIRTHPEIKQSPLPSLRYLELQITKRCNLSCKHCFVGECSKTDLSFDEILNILKEFEKMQGLRVLITGGEPLLHPEFERINKSLNEIAIRKILFTNGILLSDEWLKKLNIQEIQISLDGMREGHESLRGKGTFGKALSAIKKATAYGFDVSVATVIHKKNIHEFDDVEKLIKSLKVRDWTVDALTMSGNLKFNRDFWVEPDIAGEIMRKYGFSQDGHPRAEGYGCGAHLLAIFANGKSSFCSFFEETPLGNINEGLEILWQKKRHILLKNLQCSEDNCPYLNECFGGCRYRAITLSGKENSPDLFKCYQFGKLQS